jgi:hypothetical protein
MKNSLLRLCVGFCAFSWLITGAQRAFADRVSIVAPTNEPTIQFAVADLKVALEDRGYKVSSGPQSAQSGKKGQSSDLSI